MKLLFLTNENSEDNKALFNVDSNEVIMTGDYDNDHIEDKINGFLECLDYLEKEYTVEELYINEDSDLFEKCEFYPE